MQAGRMFLYCCLGLLLSSCGAGAPNVGPPHIEGKDPGVSHLLNIRVERWDTVRFAGLLGLRVNASGLQYVLLDATGAKLLDVDVAGEGSHEQLRVSGHMQKTDFAPFLSEALARIYLLEPAGVGCIGSWFSQVCRTESDDLSWRKYGQAGPFTVWQVTAQPSNQNGTGANADAVLYRQPWLGVRIYLEPMKLSP